MSERKFQHVPLYIEDVCKIGQGHACCRYLGVGADGIECLKLTPLKATLDARGDSMVARADNCDGVVGVITDPYVEAT
jgi:hypothetical protein